MLPLTTVNTSRRETRPLSPVGGETGDVGAAVEVVVSFAAVVEAAVAEELAGRVEPVDSPALDPVVSPDGTVPLGSVEDDDPVDSDDVDSDEVDSVDDVDSVDEEVDPPGVVTAVVGVVGLGFSSPISAKKAAIT